MIGFYYNRGKPVEGPKKLKDGDYRITAVCLDNKTIEVAKIKRNKWDEEEEVDTINSIFVEVTKVKVEENWKGGNLCIRDNEIRFPS